MNNTENRLKELRESMNYSVDDFTKIFKIHRSSLYRYEGTNKLEKRKLPMSIAIAICEKFNVSLDWLAGSSDVKYLNQTPNQLADIYNVLSEEGKKELFNYAMYLKNKETSEK